MKIVEKDAFQAIGFVVEAHWQALWEEMPKAWRELQARYEEIGGRSEDRFLDISLAEEDGQYRQLVGAMVDTGSAAPEGMAAVDIPAGRYVYFRHIGGADGIAGAFGAMYDWAREQGLQPGSFKIDHGYQVDDYGNDHELFIRLTE